MKRVSSACLYQTLHFILDPAISNDDARAKVCDEVEAYKAASKDTAQILEERTESDGSIILKVRKKVSGYPVGSYFDELKKTNP